MNIKVLVPTGALGITYCKKALDRGLKEKPDIIVVDGGSTDSGPASVSYTHLTLPTTPYV